MGFAAVLFGESGLVAGALAVDAVDVDCSREALRSALSFCSCAFWVSVRFRPSKRAHSPPVHTASTLVQAVFAVHTCSLLQLAVLLHAVVWAMVLKAVNDMAAIAKPKTVFFIYLFVKLLIFRFVWFFDLNNTPAFNMGVLFNSYLTLCHTVL